MGPTGRGDTECHWDVAVIVGKGFLVSGKESLHYARVSLDSPLPRTTDPFRHSLVRP